ncbi:MAG: acetylxylan esterase [Spirochaetes bacterium]|nr:acetylxylan esterase [Spirochaetota bacterium]
MVSFDRYFLHLPILNREKDFKEFWDKSIGELKKVPIEPVLKKDPKRSGSRFTVYDAQFTGFIKSKISGTILVPGGVSKPRVIIHIHDYNRLPDYSFNQLNESVAHFFLTLRGHEVLKAGQMENQLSPGYVIENILDRDTYYAKAVYLDTLRSIDMLRLMGDVNCSSVGIMGTGFGAAAAVFAATYSNRITGLVLDSPSFCYLGMSQNISTSDATNEINEFIATRKSRKKEIKRNLSYFDAMNFSDKINCPVLAVTGFKDTVSPPECVFALFNHLLTEKTIEVYPEEGHSPGGETQFNKSVKWLVQKISMVN